MNWNKYYFLGGQYFSFAELVDSSRQCHVNRKALVKLDLKIIKSKKDLTGRLKLGLALGSVCAVVTFFILFLFQDNLTLGAATAAPAAILIYFVLGRFF